MTNCPVQSGEDPLSILCRFLRMIGIYVSRGELEFIIQKVESRAPYIAPFLAITRRCNTVESVSFIVYLFLCLAPFFTIG